MKAQDKVRIKINVHSAYAVYGTSITLTPAMKAAIWTVIKTPADAKGRTYIVSNCGSLLISPTSLEVIQIKQISSQMSGNETTGVVYGNISNAAKNYGEDRFSTPKGHGFAAERANHLYDKLLGHKAEIIGDDNQLNGADRVVDGIQIQSKYCNSGSKCIAECFKNGQLKYINQDGTPMQIEVPSDKYNDAIKAMESRIRRGEVPGVTDPSEAKNIVRKGHFTYQQAVNIAKAGTVESIAYDAVNGAVVSAYSFGISSALTFATSLWNGDHIDVALKKSALSGLKVGGTTFATAVLSSQISKAGMNSLLVGSSEAIVKVIGPKASAVLVNSFRSGANIYGAAAMKSAAKMLRGNVITGAVSVVVLSSADVVNIFRGRISGKQLFKNIANTTASVAGGSAGWVGGAAAGAAIGSVFPGAGTAIGGVVGGIIGSLGAGAASGAVTNMVLGTFIEGDAEEMVRIIEGVFQKMAVDYLLSQEEAENIVDSLKYDLTGKKLKEMYASSDRYQFAKAILLPHIEAEANARKYIKLPNSRNMVNGLKMALEIL